MKTKKKRLHDPSKKNEPQHIASNLPPIVSVLSYHNGVVLYYLTQSCHLAALLPRSANTEHVPRELHGRKDVYESLHRDYLRQQAKYTTQPSNAYFVLILFAECTAAMIHATPTFLLSSRTVFMFSIQIASTGPSNTTHFLSEVGLDAANLKRDV